MAKISKEKGKVLLSKQMMPRDVATRWNYTYEMLSFAYTYREAYNKLTSNQEMKMRKLELSDKEWEIVNQLASVLKVSFLHSCSVDHALILSNRSSKTRYYSSLEAHPTSQR